jgi:hypothetical protein
VGIEVDNDVLVFDVVVYVAGAVDGWELGRAGQAYCCEDLPGEIAGAGGITGGGADDGDVFAATIEGPDGLGGGLKDDGVRVLAAGGNGGDGGERGAVEDDNGVAAAIGDEAVFACCVEGDAVGAMKVGDGSDGLAGGCVEDLNAGAVGDVETMGGGIGEEVVPATFAADLPLVDDLVG